MKIPPKTFEEKKKLTKAMIAGTVFTMHNLDIKQDGSLIPMIFMPVAFGAFQDWTKDELAELGTIYEYVDQAMQRGINGYPTFMSMNLINKEDWMECLEAAKELEDLSDALIAARIPEETLVTTEG